MKAIVHIGTEKTGSTTIQEFLYRNRRRLRQQKIAVLRSSGKRNDRKLPMLCMNSDRIDIYTSSQNIDSVERREKWKAKFSSQVNKELSGLRGKVDKLIISSEHFQSRLKSEQEIVRLQKLLAPYFDEFEIVVYLRRQDKVAVSLHSTRCREMWGSENIFPEGVKRGNLYFNYFRLVERWSSVFGVESISIRPFDLLASSGASLLDDFMEVAGIHRTDSMFLPTRMNEKLSKEARDVLVWYNQKHPRQTAYQLALKRYMVEVLREPYLAQDARDQEALPSQAQAKVFYSIFSESNTLLSEKYFGGEVLFDQDFNRYPIEATTKIDVESARSLVAELSVSFTSGFWRLSKKNALPYLYYLFLRLPRGLRPYIERFVR